MHRRLSALGVACALVAGLACGGGGTGGNGGSGGGGGLGGGGSGGMGGGSCPAGEGQPTAHTGQDGVLVPSMNKLVLFGGDTQQLLGRTPIYTDELWIYDVGCKVWSHPHPDVAPSARGEYAAALDTQRNRILYVGGRASSSSVLNDVWALDPAAGTFRKLAPTGTGPTPREGHRAVYDSKNDRLLVFGGNTSTFFGVMPQNDLFELKFATNADGVWNKITASGGPSAREDMAMAFHPDLGVVAVFGGCLNTECRLTTPPTGGPPSANDVYFFDVTTDTWSAPEVISDTNPRLDDKRPRERYWSELMPITLPGTPSALQGFVLFGGFDDFAQHWRNNLWALLVNPIKTQATFKALWVGDKTSGIDITAPERRFGHAAAVSGTSVWLAGGSTACGLVDDLWTFDLANPSPGSCPPGAMECWYAVTRATTGLTCDRRKTGAQVCDDVCSNPR